MEDKFKEENAGFYFTEKEIKALPKNLREKFVCKKYRTADKIYQALKAIFEFALGEELIEQLHANFSVQRIKKPRFSSISWLK